MRRSRLPARFKPGGGAGAATSSARPSRRKKSGQPWHAFLSPSRRSRLAQKVRLHAAQNVEQQLAVGLGHALQRLAAGRRADGEDVAQQRTCLSGEMQQPDAPVARDGPAARPGRACSSRSRMRVSVIGSTSRMSARPPCWMPSLRARCASTWHCERVSPSAARILLEALAHQAGDVVQQETEVARRHVPCVQLPKHALYKLAYELFQGPAPEGG